LIKFSVAARSCKAAKSSASSWDRTSTSLEPGPGKYSASIPHLKSQSTCLIQQRVEDWISRKNFGGDKVLQHLNRERDDRTYVAPASGNFPSLKYDRTCFAVQSEGMLILQCP
jgi:hypothetical protein